MTGRSEEYVTNLIQQIAPAHGTYWRNNTGVAVDETGRHVRYGLCNESKTINSKFKSSDEIGITPVIITPEWVGCRVGVFTAIEYKKEDWKFRASDDHAVAQQRFIDLVIANGGFAGFVQNEADFMRVIHRG